MNTLTAIPLLSSLPAWLSVLALSSLKALLILGLAAGAAAALRNRSAALRHWVWCLALCGVLALPALTFLLPGWAPSLSGLGPTFLTNQSGQAVEAVTHGASPSLTSMTAAEESASSLEADAVLSSSQGSAASMPGWIPSLTRWALIAWGLGALLTFLYFSVGTLRAWWWRRHATAVTDPSLHQLNDELSRQLGLTRRVQLAWNERASMPVTWGIFQPCILLPCSAASWSSERKRAVLLHELAHVQRRDGLTQIIAQAACVVNWFNPLVWWSMRQLRIERERACDDRVLTSGFRASTYADHLLHIARSLRATPGTPFGVVSMAKPSQLEKRLLAILDPDQGREGVDRARSLLVAVLALALILPLAAMRPLPSSDALATPSAAAVFPLLPPARQPVPPSSPADVVRRTFDVQEGGTLQVRTDRGSIDVRSGEGNTVQVAVHREGSAADEFEVEMQKQGSDVRIRGSMPDRSGWGWGSDAEVRYEITVPRRYNLDVQTEGGSVTVGDLTGRVDAKTAGGSLNFSTIQGPVRGQTAGGSIQLERATGDVQFKTAGGSIALGDVDGSVMAKTAGGSISLGRVQGTAEVSTSGGSISVEEVGGTIRAKTSGGSIEAFIARQPQQGSSLKTSAGSITVELAEGVGVELDAETSSGRVVTDFTTDAEEEEQQSLEAAVNGGGPPLVLRTSAGDIRVLTE